MNLSRVCLFIIANAYIINGMSVMARASVVARVSGRRQRRSEVRYAELQKKKKCEYVKKLFSAIPNECVAAPINNVYDIYTYKTQLWEFHQTECTPKELNIVESILAFLAACLIFAFILLPAVMG